jgi:death on curing protein
VKVDPIWISVDDVLAIHEKLLERHGGSAGVRDSALLESAMGRARNRFAYGESDIFGLAATYADGVVNNHPFIDGNKRTGFVIAILFLELNGRRFTASEAEAVIMTVGLADKSIAVEQFAQWLRDNVAST